MRASFAVLALATISSFALAAPATAGMCEGTVRGLSSSYNERTGSGFLAVRLRPSASSRKLGELYNSEQVEIFRRRGAWYRVASLDKNVEGWVFARYVRNSCQY